jgi:hypothetical protein
MYHGYFEKSSDKLLILYPFLRVEKKEERKKREKGS